MAEEDTWDQEIDSEQSFNEGGEHDDDPWFEDHFPTDHGEEPYEEKMEPGSEYVYEEQSHHQDFEEEEYQEETEFHISLREAERALQERAIEESWEDKTGSEISYGNEEWREEEPDTQVQHFWNDDSTHEFSPQEDYSYDPRDEWREEGYREETESYLSLEGATSFGGKPEQFEDTAEEEDVVSETGRDDCDRRYINFSGHDQGPEAYLRWERNWENWFLLNQFSEEEKTSYAEETLAGEAFSHWDIDAKLRLEYQVPHSSWKEMKELLHKEFVGEAVVNQKSYAIDHAYSEPKKNCCPDPKKVTSTTLDMDPGTEKPMVFTSKTPIEESVNPDKSRGVILSYLLNGEPPDECQGQIVSRTKPFEEGEYDVNIRSTLPEKHRGDTKKLVKTFGENQPGRTEDIGVFIGEYLLNQKELAYESTCSRKPTHQGITESWIHIKPDSDLEVIEVTIWQTGFRPPSAIGPDIRLHSPSHSRSKPQTTWEMLMNLLWFQKAQETENKPMEAQVITQSPEHVCLVLFKGNPRPDRFSNIQTYLWRPGETLNQSGELYRIILYSSSHRIRRISSPSHFPYLEPLALKLQQLFPFQLAYDLEALSTIQKVPRRHYFMPKLSRYRESRVYLE